MILYLVLENYLETPNIFLSRSILRNKSVYYKNLNNVTEKGEWEDWILYILDAIRDTANYSYGKINRIHESMKKARDIVKEKAPNAYSEELIETIFELPYVRIGTLTERGIASRNTASKYLAELAEIGVLSLKEEGKDKLFVNVEMMEILVG